MDILKLSDFPCPGVGIWQGRQMVKELELKLTLGMAERRKTESPHDEESLGGVSEARLSVRPKVIVSRSPSFPCPFDIVPVGHSADVNEWLISVSLG